MGAKRTFPRASIMFRTEFDISGKIFFNLDESVYIRSCHKLAAIPQIPEKIEET